MFHYILPQFLKLHFSQKYGINKGATWLIRVRRTSRRVIISIFELLKFQIFSTDRTITLLRFANRYYKILNNQINSFYLICGVIAQNWRVLHISKKFTENIRKSFQKKFKKWLLQPPQSLYDYKPETTCHTGAQTTNKSYS